MDPNTPAKGIYLTRGADKKWTTEENAKIYSKLQAPVVGPRILFIPQNEDPKPYETLAKDKECREILTTRYKFPKFLFEDTWLRSNGFAGLRRFPISEKNPELITVSWFRVLVKVIRRPKPAQGNDYYWGEMTFLIHDSNDGAPTVICCDVDGNFQKSMVTDLESSPEREFDWKHVHAILFRQVALEVDRSVWACSKAVRTIEKDKRPDSTTKLESSFEFPDVHDLLRHALHISETLEAACQNLKEWMDFYQNATGSHEKLLSSDENYRDMLSSIQLMQSLQKRATSNEARLRNEINLAFNMVSQQDAKAVRIISVATLLFLPATFVSTLFSMSFFNFQPPDQNDWGVSPMIWIYFAVSIPLTVLTIVLWFQLSSILTWVNKKKKESSPWLEGKKKKLFAFKRRLGFGSSGA